MRQPGEELRVFVVGMRADDQHAFVGTELLQRVGQRRDAAGAGGTELLTPDGAGGAKTESREAEERAPHYWERYTVPLFITNRTR